MILKTKNFHKIFSFLNFRSSFRFTSKLSPQEKLSKLIDEFISDIKKQDVNTPTFKEEEEKMKEIQIEYLKSTMVNMEEEKNPFKRMKKLEKKMKNKIKELERDDFDDSNEEADNLEEKSESESESIGSFEEALNEKKTENKNPENLEENSKKEEESNESNESKQQKLKHENLFETSNIGLNYIPKNLIIKTLVFPKNGSEVVLLGVEKRNEEHASFMLG